MNLLRPSLLFWVCILALLGAATAGAQTQPLEASFEVAPAAPTANAPVTFTDTTSNPTGAKLEYAWDLDADDSFDDGVTPTVTQGVPAGPAPHRAARAADRHHDPDRLGRPHDHGRRGAAAHRDRDRDADRHARRPRRRPRPRRRSSRPRRSTSRPRRSSPASAALQAPARSASAHSYALGKPKTFDAERVQRRRGQDRPLRVGRRRQQRLRARHRHQPQADHDDPRRAGAPTCACA